MTKPDANEPLNTALRYDQDKRRVDLIPVDAYLALADVYGAGAKKYPEGNWLLGMNWSRVVASMERHTLAIKGGERDDAELSALLGRPVSHAACVAWNAFTLMVYQMRGIGVDDLNPLDLAPRMQKSTDETLAQLGLPPHSSAS